MSLGRAMRFATERRDGRRQPLPGVFLHGAALGRPAPERQVLHLICLDVSPSGVRVLRPRAGLAPGDVVELTIAPSDAPAPLRARVVRAGRDAHGRAELGLAFVEATALERARVTSWLEFWSTRRAPAAIPQPDEVGLRELNAAIRASKTQATEPWPRPGRRI